MLLKVIVRDEAGERIPCTLLVRAIEGGETAEACCPGEHIFALPHGRYRVEARRGKLYHPAVCEAEPGENSALAELMLRRVFNPAGWGYYSFDGHSHISRDDNSTEPTLEAAALRMRCEDYNLFFAGSPYDCDVHFQYLQRNFTDRGTYRQKYAALMARMAAPDYLLDIGNELVKGRFGHTFLMNYDQRPPYSTDYDESFDHWIWQKAGPVPGYGLAYPHEAVLRERGANSVAAAAHPTSWWWQEGEFITNIAATVGFDVLCGTLDAFVVMGYRAERPHYQALWFDLLNQGYFLPGIAETDAVFDRVPVKHLEFRTYAESGELSIDAICRAVRAGRCIASSGPLIRLTVDGQPMGSVLRHTPGQRFALELEAVACCEGALKKAQIIQNGKVVATVDMQGERATARHEFTVEGDGYILAKCYDVAGNLAIANPVYIRNAPFVNQGYRARVRVETSASGRYWLDDGPQQAFVGAFSLAMSPASTLHVEANGERQAVKLIELPELQAIFRYLYLGDFNQGRIYEPGEVPAGAFAVRRIREILDHVQLKLDFQVVEER